MTRQLNDDTSRTTELRAQGLPDAGRAGGSVSYTRLLADDGPATMDALDAARAVFVEHIEAKQGRIVDTAGDSVLAVFETTAGAVLASVAIQERLTEINEPVPDRRRMRFRIGLHLGDIREKADGSGYGDGVAARLQGTAEPGANPNYADGLVRLSHRRGQAISRNNLLPNSMLVPYGETPKRLVEIGLKIVRSSPD